jgi:DNA repair protein RecO (recombination protein O)
VVKGVHREGEVRQAGFEIFTRAEFIFYEKKRSDLHLISDAAILESNDPIRNRLECITFGSYFCELVDELTEVHAPHPEVFELLKTALRFLPVIPQEKLTTVFEIKLLEEMGLIPYADSCVSCGLKPVEKGYFSVKQGALLCEGCRSKDHGAPAISPAGLALLRVFSRSATEDCLQGAHSPHAVAEVKRLISQFLNYRIGKVLKSRRFLESIKSVLSSK